MPEYTAADGVVIAYDDIGPPDGAPFLLIHGFVSNRQEGWKRTGWYAALAQRGQRLIALDLRGHGESGKPHDPAAYDRDLMLGDIVGLLDHLGVEWANVFGYSMGARLALAMALQAHERVGYLVLGGVGGRLLEPPPPGDITAEAMEADDPAAIAEPLLRSFRQFADEQGEDRLALAALARTPPRGFTADDLLAVRAPTLIVAGTRDELAGDPQALADVIRGAKAVTLAGCDHFNAIPHGLLKATVFDFLDGYLDEM
ncbi:alpha/beta fold hydrolase [Caulobacter mirabilis]|uniref:Alpha/beta hydrolase n=1 Tax=Caulobacter mirabilis TaxID=69666 RepID=A0A2D2B241_9CAUL|nr:alpha/beta fold hydrolase [Caulobacter mirabilis]ATQ44333.1 alpha/beta hydrolase [Caulobacter mirabilis]